MPGRILVDTTPLRESRDFRLLFTGQLISVIGTQLTVVAIPYQVYSMTPVSYTHLDVYKRQPWGCAPWPRTAARR